MDKYLTSFGATIEPQSQLLDRIAIALENSMEKDIQALTEVIKELA